MKQKFLICAIASILTAPSYSQSGCESYPYGPGMNVEEVDGGTKILSTASVAVSMDDIDSINDAREEATIEAKSAIAKFLTEDIKSDSAIDKVVKESKRSDGKEVQRTRRESIDRVKGLRNNAQALLRGVVPLGECYTKARELRVSVGIKPETIRAAERSAGDISRSVASTPTTRSSSSASSGGGGSAFSGSSNQHQPQGVSQPLRGMDGYSNSERLKKF